VRAHLIFFLWHLPCTHAYALCCAVFMRACVHFLFNRSARLPLRRRPREAGAAWRCRRHLLAAVVLLAEARAAACQTCRRGCKTNLALALQLATVPLPLLVTAAAAEAVVAQESSSMTQPLEQLPLLLPRNRKRVPCFVTQRAFSCSKTW